MLGVALEDGDWLRDSDGVPELLDVPLDELDRLPDCDWLAEAVAEAVADWLPVELKLGVLELDVLGVNVADGVSDRVRDGVADPVGACEGVIVRVRPVVTVCVGVTV